MRAVIQRVKAACLAVNKENRAIGEGYVVLLGICNDDTEEDVAWLVKKIIGLRVFSDAEGVMNLDIKSLPMNSASESTETASDGAKACKTGDIMVVSQFTLYASYKKGNRPSWIHAAGHDVAIPLYQRFCSEIQKALGKPIVTGEFGADMKVLLCNDGPVTICMDTKNKE